MFLLQLHDTISEDVLGMVYPSSLCEFDTFYGEIEKTWLKFNKINGLKDVGDYIEFHNKISNVTIDNAYVDFIQL